MYAEHVLFLDLDNKLDVLRLMEVSHYKGFRRIHLSTFTCPCDIQILEIL